MELAGKFKRIHHVKNIYKVAIPIVLLYFFYLPLTYLILAVPLFMLGKMRAFYTHEYAIEKNHSKKNQISIQLVIDLFSFFLCSFSYLWAEEIKSITAHISLLLIIYCRYWGEVYSKLQEKRFLLLSLLMIVVLTLLSQHVVMTVISFFTIIFIFYHFFYLSAQDDELHEVRMFKQEDLSLNTKDASIFLIISLPMALLGFLLFPRFPSPVVNKEMSALGQVGLSEKIELGGMRKLIETDEVVFRVNLESALPIQMEDLYFRANVLWKTDGQSWTRGALKEKAVPHQGHLRQIGKAENLIKQKYLLNQQSHAWIFFLDYFVQIKHPANRDFAFFSGDVIKMNTPPAAEKYYEVESYPTKYKMSFPVGEGQDEFAKGLQLPAKIDPRLVALVEGMKNELAQKNAAVAHGASKNVAKTEAMKIVDKILNFYLQKNFRYSLETQDDEKNPLAHFLLVSRKGFCEHFASSFAFLLRMMGVPARVVIGYQGGEYNDIGDYYVVHQRDAHAWTEVGITDSFGRRRWMRVDPLDTVAPARLSMGQSEYWRNWEDIFLASGNKIPRRKISWWERPFYSMKYIYDTISSRWGLFIMSYDQEMQRMMIAEEAPLNVVKLFKTQKNLILLLLMILALFLFFCLAVVLFLWPKRDERLYFFRLYDLWKRQSLWRELEFEVAGADTEGQLAPYSLLQKKKKMIQISNKQQNTEKNKRELLSEIALFERCFFADHILSRQEMWTMRSRFWRRSLHSLFWSIRRYFLSGP